MSRFVGNGFAALKFRIANGQIPFVVNALEEPSGKGITRAGGLQERIILRSGRYQIGLVRNFTSAVAVKSNNKFIGIFFPNGINRLIGSRHGRRGKRCNTGDALRDFENSGRIVILGFRPALENITGFRRNAASADRNSRRSQRSDVGVESNVLDRTDITGRTAVRVKTERVLSLFPLRNQIIGVADGNIALGLFDRSLRVDVLNIRRIIDIICVSGIGRVGRIQQFPSDKGISFPARNNRMVADLLINT